MNIDLLGQRTTLAFLGLLLLSFSVKGQQYPIHITEEGHIIIQVTLSDSIKGNFILDTGAGINVLSARMFGRVKEYAQKSGYYTGFRHDGDRLDGEVFTIPSIAIDRFKQINPIVGVYPPLDDFGIDGLLSLKFFEHQPFSIDFKNGELSFLEKEEMQPTVDGAIRIPISVKQDANLLLDIFIPIRLNDEINMLAEFDTGSGYGAYIINPEYVNDLRLDSALAKPQPYVTQLSGEERTDYIYTLKSIAVGETPLRKENVKAIFREGLIYNALIGSGMFREKKITIDIPNRSFIVHP